MQVLNRDDLLSLERYAAERGDFRARVIGHKKNRAVSLGGHVRLLFEDRLTIQYQIQEMLRIERIFEAEAIQEELDAYNPLIPQGRDWRGTILIEYPDVAERRAALARLLGIDRRIHVQVADERVYAVTNEDLERDTEEKTSSVHFFRLPLTDSMVAALKAGAELCVGVDHAEYAVEVTVSEQVRLSLLGDLD